MVAHKIKLYKYYFVQLEKPIVMEANSRQEADYFLRLFNEKIGGKMSINDMIDLRVETLIVGESSKIKKGEKFIWVGTNFSEDGWMLEQDYLKIVIKNKKKQYGE